MSTKIVDRGWRRILENISVIDNKEVVVGILGGVPYASFHEFGTSKMVPRPFMRQTFETRGAKARAVIAAEYALIMSGQGDGMRALNRVGIAYRGFIQKTIRTGNFAPLRPRTVAQKKNNSTKPLIDTARMIGSVSYEIR